MKNRICLALTLLVFSTISHANQLTRQTDVLDYFSAKNEISITYNLCYEKYGANAFRLDYIKHIWELKTQLVSEASLNVLRNISIDNFNNIKENLRKNREDVEYKTKQSLQRTSGQYCSRFFSDILASKSYQLIEQQQTLLPLLGSNEAVRIMKRNIDLEIGCVKEGYNSGIENFTLVAKACQCTKNIITQSLTDREIDYYLELVSKNKQQSALEFLTQEVDMLKLKQCYL